MSNITAGSDAPAKVNAIIEIPKGSNVKYEHEKSLNIIKVDRILHTSMVYPYNYGYIPGTLAEDGDPMDILVITASAFYPFTMVGARIIGALHMKDEAGIDTKIIAVPVEKVDPDQAAIKDIDDLGEHTKKLIGHFFSYYKSIEPGKWAEIGGWVGAKDAQTMVQEGIDRLAKK
jgi:inorganic pyrophosphatase